MDLKSLTVEQLDALRIEVLCEQERRDRLSMIPDQIAELRGEYIAAGGDPADIT